MGKEIRVLALGLAATTVFSAGLSEFAYANTSSNFDLRKKVIGITGITAVSGNVDRYVTRAEFARMLVLASTYRGVLTYSSNVSVFADVAGGNEYASAIRLAAEQGWMTGYLGGSFKPDQYVTLNEAAKGVLYLLGYTATDFDGDQYNKRMAMYSYLELNENISISSTDSMTLRDCINLFYNLLKTNSSGTTTAYVTVLGGELNDDGEVNALTLADNSLKGPKVASSVAELTSAVPFELSEANLFLNGEAVSYTALKSAMQSSEFGIVVYYSTVAKTIWAYDENSDSTSGRRVVYGEITNIYYESTSTLTPSSVVIDNGDTYLLSSTDMQFAFSIYGSLQVGDDVTLVIEVSTDTDGNETYTVVDYVVD